MIIELDDSYDPGIEGGSGEPRKVGLHGLQSWGVGTRHVDLSQQLSQGSGVEPSVSVFFSLAEDSA